jgi:hypothetical protein
MAVIGEYRSNYSFDILNFSALLDSFTKRFLTFDGADLGYYCSLTFVMVADKVSTAVRFDMFQKFLLSLVKGGDVTLLLQNFTRSYYSHWNGGFFPLYFYFYGGFQLVVVVSLLWGRFIINCVNYSFKKHTSFFAIVGVYMVCIAARWYMYSPLNAFRPLIIFTVIYFTLFLVDSLKGRFVNGKKTK